jgi:hypothetical protein
LTCHQLTVHL